MPNTLLNETLRSVIQDERVRAVVERSEAERRGARAGSPNANGQSQDPYDYADRGFSIRPQQGDLIYLLCKTPSGDIVRQFRYYLVTAEAPEIALRFREAVRRTIQS